MTCRHNKLPLCICGRFCILLALMLLLVPLRWLGAWLTAGVLHEIGHYGMLRLRGKRVYGIRVDWNGILMETEPLGRTQWLCALAGPITSLLLIGLYRWLPRIAICAFVQAVTNLLPIYPLDGGRVLVGLLSLCLPEKNAYRVSTVVSGFAIVLVAGAVSYFVGHGLALLACLMILLFKAMGENPLAKMTGYGYNSATRNE